MNQAQILMGKQAVKKAEEALKALKPAAKEKPQQKVVKTAKVTESAAVTQDTQVNILSKNAKKQIRKNKAAQRKKQSLLEASQSKDELVNKPTDIGQKSDGEETTETMTTT